MARRLLVPAAESGEKMGKMRVGEEARRRVSVAFEI